MIQVRFSVKTGLFSAVLLAIGPALQAQSVISARSGLIHHIEGTGVTLEGQPLKPKKAEFPQMKDGETLVTDAARVEVLLNPGAFLRMDEHSSLKLISGRLSDTRVEMLSGSAVLELDDLQKGNFLMLQFHDVKITPTKHGLYRMDAGQNRFRVFEGEAQVLRGDDAVQVKGGHQVEFDAVLASSKFRKKAQDSLDLWAAERSEEIALANFSSANMVRRAGTSSYTSSGWYFNPYLSMFSYLPFSGYGYSPYGWLLYSPRTIVYYYAPTSYPQQSASTNSAENRGNVGSFNSAITSPNSSIGSIAAPVGASSGGMGGTRAPASSGGAGGGRGR
jgi:hypothetical protein